MDNRLAPGIEVSALIRAAEQQGGMGMVLKKGDPDRGSIVIQVTSRGRHHALVDRALQPDGDYSWEICGPKGQEWDRVEQYLTRRRENDPDCWIIELDIPVPERFIAETTSRG